MTTKLLTALCKQPKVVHALIILAIFALAIALGVAMGMTIVGLGMLA